MPKIPPSDYKTCHGCGTVKVRSEYYERIDAKDGLEGKCKMCRDSRSRKTRGDTQASALGKQAARAQARADGTIPQTVINDKAARARRLASNLDALKIEDFDADYDVSISNVKADRKLSAQASKEKRQEFNRKMGDHAEALKSAGATAHERDGDVLGAMPADSGTYIGQLAEQERRFGNRRMARTISLAQAGEALSLQLFKQIARQFFADKITATGYAKTKPSKPAKRSVVLLLSDLHLGSDLSSLDEPMPFRAIEESRRLEYILRQAMDYKFQYRANTELVLCLNGDLIEGQLMHQIGAGAPLAEQKAIFWTYFRRILAELSAVYPSIRVFCQPGNHGRDKVRHPGRATWRKWDGHEFEIMWALKEMCSGLRNVTWDVPFRAVSMIDLHGQNLLLTHGDTEIKLGHPDGAAKSNARELDRCNASRLFDAEFQAAAFGHFHSGRTIYGNTVQIWNGALVPPNGHARASGYIAEAMGQFLWEAVEGHPVGDVRFIRVGPEQDRDEKLGKIIAPFRFPTS